MFQVINLSEHVFHGQLSMYAEIMLIIWLLFAERQSQSTSNIRCYKVLECVSSLWMVLQISSAGAPTAFSLDLFMHSQA